MKNLQKLVCLVLSICIMASLVVVRAEDSDNNISLQADGSDVLAGPLTFDDCSTLAGLKALPEIDISGMVQDISIGAVSDDDTFKPSVKMGKAEQVGLDFKIPGAARTEGAYKVTYWLYNATGVQVVVDAPMQTKSWANGAFSLLYLSGNKASVDNLSAGSVQLGPTLATLEENKWYRFEHIIDLNDRLVTGFVYDATGNKLGESEPYEMKQWHGDQTYVVDHFQSFRIRNWKDAHTYLDNFKIEEYYATPEINRKKILFEMLDGSVLKETNRIGPGVDKIVLNFGTVVDETAAENSIKLTKDGGGVVAYSGTVEKNNYVMNLSDILEPNSTYTLDITTGVTNTKGKKLKEALSFEFETTEGGFKTAELSIKNDGEDVENIEGIPGCDTLRVDVKYQNLLDEPKYLTCVVGYYDAEGRMIDKIIRKITATAKTAQTVTIPCDTVPVNCSSVKAFLWDGLETMVAYQDACGVGTQPTNEEVEGSGYGNVFYDYYHEKVTIYGKTDEADGSGAVNIQVLKSGEVFEDFEDKTDAEKENALLYLDQQNVKDTEGKFSFVIGYDDLDLPIGTTKAVDHQARIVAENGDVIENMTISLATKEIYQAAVAALNLNASNTSVTDAQFAEMVKSEKGGINFQLGGLAETDLNAETIRSYRKYIANNPMLPEETMKNRGIFLDFMLLEAAKAGKTQNVNELKNEIFFAQDDLKTNYLALAKSNIITEYFTNKFEEVVKDYCKTTNDFTLNHFTNAWKAATILTVARYGTGWGELKDAVMAYGSVLNVVAVVNNSVYQTLMGKEYTQASFKIAYDAVINAGQSDFGSFGGAGGGGGFSSAPPIGNVEITPVENETEKPIKMNFIDIDGVAWASEAILALADKGIVNGKEEEIFKPNDLITREEFVKILIGAMGLQNESYTNHFEDVRDADWFCKWVNIAYENGICKGVDDTTFGVGQQLSRQDMVVLINNALKMKGISLPETVILSFEDRNTISDYALQAVSNMVSIGAVKGVSETMFEPFGQATRAQAATIIYRVLEQLQ